MAEFIIDQLFLRLIIPDTIPAFRDRTIIKIQKLKKLLFVVIMIAAAASANSQELLFKVKQSGSAYKNSNTGKFTDAEVSDMEATIYLQTNKVLVDADTKESYTIDKKGLETKVHENVVSCTYNGKDEKNAPISFIYTVNLNSKEAVVEVATKKSKTFYFGTYSSLDFTKDK